MQLAGPALGCGEAKRGPTRPSSPGSTQASLPHTTLSHKGQRAYWGREYSIPSPCWPGLTQTGHITNRGPGTPFAPRTVPTPPRAGLPPTFPQSPLRSATPPGPVSPRCSPPPVTPSSTPHPPAPHGSDRSALLHARPGPPPPLPAPTGPLPAPAHPSSPIAPPRSRSLPPSRPQVLPTAPSGSAPEHRRRPHSGAPLIARPRAAPLGPGLGPALRGPKPTRGAPPVGLEDRLKAPCPVRGTRRRRRNFLIGRAGISPAPDAPDAGQRGGRDVLDSSAASAPPPPGRDQPMLGAVLPFSQ